MHNLNQFDGGIKKNEQFRVSIQKSCYEKSYILDSTLWQIGKRKLYAQSSNESETTEVISININIDKTTQLVPNLHFTIISHATASHNCIF